IPRRGGSAVTDANGAFEIGGLPTSLLDVGINQLSPILDAGAIAPYTNLAAFFPGAFPLPGVQLDYQVIHYNLDSNQIMTVDVPVHPYSVVSGRVMLDNPNDRFV